jgi:hypothetical protein
MTTRESLKQMKNCYSLILFAALILSANLGCNPEVMQTTTIRTTPVKLVAEAGDVQLENVPDNSTGVAIAFLATRNDNAEEYTATFFGAFRPGGGGTSEARPLPHLIAGQTFAAGHVLVELRQLKGPGVLMESTQSVVADSSKPLIIDVASFANVEGGSSHDSLWGHGKVGDAE